MINITKYYLNSDSDYSPAFQRAIAAAIDSKKAVYIPEGTYNVSQIVLPRESVELYGCGDNSKIIGNSQNKEPMFVWEDGISIIRCIIKNIWFEQTGFYGSILDHSPASEWKRLQLTLADCVFKYRGGGSAVNLHGLVSSEIRNVDIKDGSPVGGGSPSGLGMNIKDSSTTHLWNVRFYSGICGRGIVIEGGGEIYIHGSRLDGGSRSSTPGYHIKGAHSVFVDGLCGEGTDDTPFLLIENSHDIKVSNFVAPSCSQKPSSNIIEIINSHNVCLDTGRLEDQFSFGGPGVGLYVDSNSSLIDGKMIRIMGTQYTDNIICSGTNVNITGVYGGSNFYYPPTTRFTYTTD